MMAAVAAMFAFTACGGDEPAADQPKPQQPAGKTQLEKPVVTITDVTETGFTVNWEAVANATEYVVYVNKDLQPKTTATTYTFTDLNAGEYKPRVKALGGENYKDSEYSDVVSVTLTGATSVSWFQQTVSLPEDNAENAAKGINSSNTFRFTWKGEGVESLSYMYFYADELPATEDEIISAMQALDAETLAEVNSAEGVEFMFSDLAGGIEYVMCAYVTKGGKEFLAIDNVTTSNTILTLGTEAWLGSWNAYSPQMVDVQSNTFTEQRTDYTLTVTPYNEYFSNYVWVDGFSVLGEGAPAFGVISHEKVDGAYTGNYNLQLMCYETIGQIDEANGIWAVWMPLCSYNAGYTFVMGSFAGYTLTLNPTTGAVTCKPYSGTLSNNSPFEVKMMDIFGVDGNNSLYLLSDANGDSIVNYMAGGIQGVTKAAAAASVASKKAFKAGAVLPASVVVM